MCIARPRRHGGRLVRSARPWSAVTLAMLLAISCATSAEVTDSPDSTTPPATTAPQADSTPTAVSLTAVPQPASTQPEPTSVAPTAGPTEQPTSAPSAATPTPRATAAATPTPARTAATPTAAAMPTPTESADVVHGDRWSARKLLVDLDDAAVAREIAALDAQRSPDEVLVIAKDTSCGVLDTHAIAMPDGVVVEIFFDKRIQCVRAVESTALFLIDAAGTNSHGSWNYRSAPLVNIIRTGVEERPTSVPTQPGASPTVTVERVTSGPAAAGIVATTVLTDPGPGEADDVLDALRAANSSGAVIVVANFQGCVLIGARAIPKPTQVVVQATFDADIDCFRAYNYQAFFVIESSGVNTHGAWNYAHPPNVTVEYIDQS